MPLQGLQIIARSCLEPMNAHTRFLANRAYLGFSTPEFPVNFKTPKQGIRNALIRAQFKNGRSITELSEEYEITPQRIYQIIYKHR